MLQLVVLLLACMPLVAGNASCNKGKHQNTPTLMKVPWIAQPQRTEPSPAQEISQAATVEDRAENQSPLSSENEQPSTGEVVDRQEEPPVLPEVLPTLPPSPASIVIIQEFPVEEIDEETEQIARNIQRSLEKDSTVLTGFKGIQITATANNELTVTGTVDDESERLSILSKVDRLAVGRKVNDALQVSRKVPFL